MNFSKLGKIEAQLKNDMESDEHSFVKILII